MTGSQENCAAQGRGFVRNVLWNWLGTIVSLFIGFILSPYLILKLGADGYGVWAITFALVEYYWFFDFGFRSATVKFVAHYSTTGDAENVRAVLSTVLLYSSLAATAIILGVLALARHIQQFFRIPDNLRPSFETLLILITMSWCLGLVFNVFNAALEAVQHFEYSNKAAIVSALVRAAGWASALYLGFGLVAIGMVTVLSQTIGYAVNYFYFRRVFPGQNFSFRFARLSTLREMLRFGVHTFVVTISTQLRNQGAPLLIGHFLPAAFVGFFNLPVRLLQYTVELVGRIGIVTNTKAAELAARENSESLTDLAVYTNRYCLVIFMPLAILLGTHGSQLLALWVGPAFAVQSAPILLPLLVGCVVGVVGQYSASMLLQGLGKHQGYARSLFVEAVIGTLLLLIVIPRWGIAGAAWVAGSLAVVIRGFVSAWLVSRIVGLSFAKYLNSVYTRPALCALPAFGIATILPGGGWMSLLGLTISVSAFYYTMAFFLALDGKHRALLVSWQQSPRKAAAHG